MNDWTSPADIRPDHLEIVQNILREHLPAGFKVWVFGSRANWTTKDSSDLDLAVEGTDTLDHKAMVGLEVAFEESDLPYTVDVVDLNAVSTNFREIVEGQRVPLPSVDRQAHTRAGWRELPFSQAVQVNPVVRLERGGIYPFVDMSAVNADSRNTYFSEERPFKGGGSRFQNGDTLMARITPCLENGKIARYCSPDITEVGHGSTEFIVIRGRPNVTDNDFAYYLTQWKEVRNYAIGQMTGTSGRQRVPADSLDHLIVPVPPLPEQRAIAHVLGTLDDKIELNQRTNQTLEEMARAIFQDWFVDFGPVRAKLEGREPYLPPELWDLFPDRLVDSELGEAPEGWGVKALGEVVELNPREPMKRGTIAPYIEMAALPTSGSCPDEAVLREFTSGTRFRNADSLLARITPCLENGKTALVQSLPEDTVGWGSTEFIVMRSIPPVPAEYPYLLGRDEGFRDHAIQSMTGTSGRQRVQIGALAPYLLPFPPTDVWAKFGSLVRPMFADIETTRKESQSLAAQRDALLPRLVSGNLQVQRNRLEGS